jgi:hypothetical protein
MTLLNETNHVTRLEAMVSYLDCSWHRIALVPLNPNLSAEYVVSAVLVEADPEVTKVRLFKPAETFTRWQSPVRTHVLHPFN